MFRQIFPMRIMGRLPIWETLVKNCFSRWFKIVCCSNYMNEFQTSADFSSSINLLQEMLVHFLFSAEKRIYREFL
jgi:hypothetical protein